MSKCDNIVEANLIIESFSFQAAKINHPYGNILSTPHGDCRLDILETHLMARGGGFLVQHDPE